MYNYISKEVLLHFKNVLYHITWHSHLHWLIFPREKKTLNQPSFKMSSLFLLHSGEICCLGFRLTQECTQIISFAPYLPHCSSLVEETIDLLLAKDLGDSLANRQCMGKYINISTCLSMLFGSPPPIRCNMCSVGSAVSHRLVGDKIGALFPCMCKGLQIQATFFSKKKKVWRILTSKSCDKFLSKTPGIFHSFSLNLVK